MKNGDCSVSELLSLVGTVDDSSGIIEVLVRAINVMGKPNSGEHTLLHAQIDDFPSIGWVESEVWVANQINVKGGSELLIIALPGELDVSSSHISSVLFLS